MLEKSLEASVLRDETLKGANCSEMLWNYVYILYRTLCWHLLFDISLLDVMEKTV